MQIFKPHFLKLSLLINFLLVANVATAGVFKISNRSYGSYSAFQSALDAMFDSLETQVNTQLPSSAATPYLTGVANATQIAGSGLGTDYTSRFNYFNLGFTLGGAADLGSNSINDVTSGTVKPEQLGGFSFQAGFILGTQASRLGLAKLGFIDGNRLKLFMHYFGQSQKLGTVDGSFQSFGFLGQYLLVPEKEWSWFGSWTGVTVTTGLRSTKMKILVSQSINQTYTTVINIPAATTATTTFNGTADVGANVNMTTIPIEAVTGVKLLIFGLYTGLGVDINSGSADSVASISGPVSVTASPSISGVSGDASLDLGETGKPATITSRYFVGGSLNLGVGGLFLQYNRSLSNNSIGLTGGARIYF